MSRQKRELQKKIRSQVEPNIWKKNIFIYFCSIVIVC